MSSWSDNTFRLPLIVLEIFVKILFGCYKGATLGGKTFDQSSTRLSTDGLLTPFPYLESMFSY